MRSAPLRVSYAIAMPSGCSSSMQQEADGLGRERGLREPGAKALNRILRLLELWEIGVSFLGRTGGRLGCGCASY